MGSRIHEKNVETIPKDTFQFEEARTEGGGGGGMGLKGSGNLLGEKRGGVTYGEERLSEFGGVGVELIKVTTNMLPLDGQTKGDEAGRYIDWLTDSHDKIVNLVKANIDLSAGRIQMLRLV